MENKLKTIRQACIEANPSIMAIIEGCKIKVMDFGTGEYSGHWTNAKAPIHHESSGYYVQRHGMGWDGHYSEAHCVYEYHDGKKKENPDVEILGRPIRLADVLLAIKKTDRAISVYEDGMFIDHSKNEMAMNTRFYWNLLKDRLEDQSDETLTFLAELLK